jgi:predicted Fe-Mo cluster-binding NifX family protein
MKIAIPLDDTRRFSSHYGASSAFACSTIDRATGRIGPLELLLPTGGSPCAWPAWLHAEGVDVLLVGGMGSGARAACAEHGITVVPGVSPAEPGQLAADYAAGRIQPGANTCADDEGHDHHHHHGHAHEHGHEHGCCRGPA